MCFFLMSFSLSKSAIVLATLIILVQLLALIHIFSNALLLASNSSIVKDIIDNPGELKITWDGVNADYSRGDILIWDKTASNKYGHVAILVALYNTKYFIVLEQDGFAQDGCKLAFRSRENLRGCLYKG